MQIRKEGFVLFILFLGVLAIEALRIKSQATFHFLSSLQDIFWGSSAEWLRRRYVPRLKTVCNVKSAPDCKDGLGATCNIICNL